MHFTRTAILTISMAISALALATPITHQQGTLQARSIASSNIETRSISAHSNDLARREAENNEIEKRARADYVGYCEAKPANHYNDYTGEEGTQTLTKCSHVSPTTGHTCGARVLWQVRIAGHH